MEPTQSSAHSHKRPGTGVGDAAAAASSEIWANKERKPLLSLVPSIQPQKKKKKKRRREQRTEEASVPLMVMTYAKERGRAFCCWRLTKQFSFTHNHLTPQLLFLED